jgi:hypothetical protein
MQINFNTKIPFKPKRLLIDKLMNPIWSATAYGNQKWIRRYAFYPRFLPLCIATDHAPGIPAEVSKTYFTDAPFTLIHSEIYCNYLREISQNKFIPFKSPFVFYTKNKKVKLQNDRNGSIYFYAHGNNEVLPTKRIDDIISDISNLPKRYFPITICLHYQDLINKVHLDFISKGFKVICMGNPNDWNFIENYYNNLSTYKYAFSSNFSSYSLYCTNFGIPFGLLGEESLFNNLNDNTISKGLYKGYLDNSDYSTTFHSLFNKLPTEVVNNEQLAFVNEYLGVESGLSRLQLSIYLYRALIISIFKLKFWNKYFKYLLNNL